MPKNKLQDILCRPRGGGLADKPDPDSGGRSGYLFVNIVLFPAAVYPRFPSPPNPLPWADLSLLSGQEQLHCSA